MEKVEIKNLQPIFWFLWGIITLIAGIMMQILSLLHLYEYIMFIWIVLFPLGICIQTFIGYKYYKNEPISYKNLKLRNKPFLFPIWISMAAIGITITIFLIKNDSFNLIWPIWFLLVGVGCIQTANIFRSYFWSGKIFYIFGIIMFIFGILIFIFELLLYWATLIFSLLLGLCWLMEGIRGRMLNGKWI